MKTLLISLLLISSSAFAERFVVEATHRLTQEQMKKAGVKLTPFYPTEHEYFSRLYVVETERSREELQKLSWVKLVESSFELMKFSLLPAASPRQIVKDELFSYQWGLLNQEQTYLREKDDIHNLPLKGVPGKDIGWEKLLRQLSTNRTIVAVLDSGIDLNHPELKDNLWRNEKECDKDPTKDNDGNQLPGDCHGWNFTEYIESSAAKDPSDKDGHGTHVAGIIAAGLNDKGIVGVAPNALIMPIKVIRDTYSESTVPSSEAFAHGIIYAVDNGAKVINMSLGWPRSLETNFLREAVYYALNRGVVIVAAAGNNNSSEPLYPCAYEMVICVAASTLDGSFAGFSNFGGHVDTVAPGEGILSTHPTLYEPELFPVPGFEVRSGTSQAAPFVAGLVASVLAHDKELSLDDIFARLYQGDELYGEGKYVMGAMASYELLNAPIKGAVVRPVLKSVRELVLTSNTGKLSIPVRNFGDASSKVEVSLELESDGVQVLTSTQSIEALEKGEAKDVIFEIEVTDMSVESHLRFKLTLNEAGKSRSFVNEIPVLRDVRRESSFKKIEFDFTGPKLPLGGVRNGRPESFLSTLESYGPSEQHQLFLRRVLRDEKKLELTVFTRESERMKQAPNLILVDHAVTLVNFIRVDLDFDGEKDYFIQTVAEKDGEKFFQFSFYNSQLQDLWPEFQNIPLKLDLYLEQMNHFVFTKYKHPELGKILLPAFFTSGQLPKDDQVITSWDRLDSSRKNRLYYLLPDLKEQVLKVRSLTTNVWEEQLKKELKTKWYETVMVEQVLPTSAADVAAGQVRVLVSVGENSRRQWIIHSFDATDTQSSYGENLPQLVLQTIGIDPLLKLTHQGLQNEGDVYFNIYDRTRSKLITTKGLKQDKEFNYRHDSETDLVAGHIASFETEKGRLTVLQTRDELIAISKGTHEKVSRRAKLRYSFLSLKLLSEMYYPVSYKRNGQHSPALYVDGTAVTGNRIYLFEEQEGELVSSIQNSLALPNNCRALNPKFSEGLGTHEFVFLCLEEAGWLIRTWPMN